MTHWSGPEVDRTGWLYDGEHVQVDRVPLDELVEWRSARGLAPVCRLEWPGGETWPPVVWYAPVGSEYRGGSRVVIGQGHGPGQDAENRP